VSGFRTNLLTGLAVLLSNAGIGSWNESGVYTSDQTGIVIGTVPQSPDRIITLTSYGASGDSPALSDSILGVQVRCRWDGEDPRPVDDLADSIYDFLHGRTHYLLSTGVAVVQSLCQSGPTSIGQDSDLRWSNVTNYYVIAHRPSTYRQ